MASQLHHLLAKGVEWGSLVDDDDNEQKPQIHPEPEPTVTVTGESEFQLPKTRNVRRKQLQYRRAAERRLNTRIFVFSDVFDWTESPFRFEGIVSTMNEMEHMFDRFKWCHAISMEEKLIWNKHGRTRSLHEPDAAYMERFNKAVIVG